MSGRAVIAQMIEARDEGYQFVCVRRRGEEFLLTMRRRPAGEEKPADPN